MDIAAAKLVVDTRNTTKDVQQFKDKVIKLRAGNSLASLPRHLDDHKKASISIVTH